ncbi:MAG: peptidylprolyl isomerase [Bacteroidetes bacterium HGW-Bacteroidetes-2]|jgi:hypothetical protein|nr:MAG: peptidylprolyl isomerase [Bacteroidetes bacterium HGW-Bacteroidetes-2]
MYKFSLLFLFATLFLSCAFFQTVEQEQAIARVGNEYLYLKDIEDRTKAATSEEDSILIVQNYITNWATQKLLTQLAKINLSEEKLQAYDALVDAYRTDLYTKGYADIIATKTLNTSIVEKEYESFYEQNKENFILNEELIQLRYINVGEENTSIDKIKQQLIRFNKNDQEELEAKAFQFKSYSLNDSLWVQVTTVMDKIPVHQNDKSQQLLKKSNYIELQDSLGVYLVQIKDVLLRNEIAPLSFIKPTIEAIILNKRKLEIIKNLEKDILQDALKTKNFETYN